METSSTGFTKLVLQTGLLVILLIYLIFVASLSREVSFLTEDQALTKISRQAQAPLTLQDEVLSVLLFQNNITKVENELFVAVNSRDESIDVKPLSTLIFDAFINVFLSIVALILLTVLIPTFGAIYQRRKTDVFLAELCDESEKVIAYYEDASGKNHNQEPIAKLNWSIQHIAKLTREYHEKIEQYVFRDKLTQLTDRHTFLEHLHAQVNEALQNKQKRALLFIDLDGFKQVNDSFGHSFGDEVLIQVAERLRSVVRSQNLNFNPAESKLEYNLARLGGDEFTILIQDVSTIEHTVNVARHVLHEIEKEFVLGNKKVKISASIGIAVYPDSAATPNALLQMADVAMYRAKTDGRGIYRIYSPEMGNKVRRYHYLLDEMRLAIATDGFSLSFQPIIQIGDCSIDYFEALVRWNHPVEGNITPGEFIPIAEESNLILDLGDWILNEACRQMAAWYNAGLKRVKISVNVSGIQLKHRPLYDWVISSLNKMGLPPSSLMLEITESCFIDASPDTIKELQHLRDEGVIIAIDDFGTGFSSLGVLANLPIDVLKIDRMFITEAQENQKYHKILTSINELASELDLKVVAEGVEQSEQLEMLRELGVKHIQGYFISRPESSANVGAKVLDKGMNHVALMGTGVWQPETESKVTSDSSASVRSLN